MVRAATMTIGSATVLLGPPITLRCADNRYVMCLPFTNRVDVFDAGALLDVDQSLGASHLEPPGAALLASLPASGWPLVGACRIAAGRSNHPDRLLLVDEEGTINFFSFDASVNGDDGSTRFEVRSHGCLTVDATWWRVKLPPSLETFKETVSEGRGIAANPSGTLVAFYCNVDVLFFDVVTREQVSLKPLAADICSVSFTDDRTLLLRRPASMSIVTITVFGSIGSRFTSVTTALPLATPRVVFPFPGVGNTMYHSKLGQCYTFGAGPPQVSKAFEPSCSHEVILATRIAHNGGDVTYIATNRRLLMRSLRDPTASVVATLPSDASADLDGPTNFVSLCYVQRANHPTVLVVSCDSCILLWHPTTSHWSCFWYAGRGTCIATDTAGRAFAGSLTGVVRRFAKGVVPEVLAEVQLQHEENDSDDDAVKPSSPNSQSHVGLHWLPRSSTIVARGVTSTACLRVDNDEGVVATEVHPKLSSSYVVATREVSMDGETLTVVIFRHAVDVVRFGAVVAQWASPCPITHCAVSDQDDAFVAVAHGHECSVLRLKAVTATVVEVETVKMIELGKPPAALALLEPIVLVSFFDAPSEVSCWSLDSNTDYTAWVPLQLTHTSIADKTSVIVSMQTGQCGLTRGMLVAASNQGHLWIVTASPASTASSPPRASQSFDSTVTLSAAGNPWFVTARLLDGLFRVAPLIGIGPSNRVVLVQDGSPAAATAYVSLLVIVPGRAAAQFTIGCAVDDGGRVVPLLDDVEDVDIDVRGTMDFTSATFSEAFDGPCWVLSGAHTGLTVWRLIDPATATVEAYVSQKQIAPRGACVRAIASVECRQRGRFAAVTQALPTEMDAAQGHHWPVTVHLLESWSADIKIDAELELEGKLFSSFDVLAATYDEKANLLILGGAQMAPGGTAASGLLVAISVDPLRVTEVVPLPDPVLSLSAADDTGAVFAACGRVVLCFKSSDLRRPLAEWSATNDGQALSVSAAPTSSGDFHCTVACGFGLRVLRLVRDVPTSNSNTTASSAQPTATNTGGAMSPPRFALLTKDPTLNGIELVAPFATDFRVSFSRVFAASADCSRNVYVSELPVGGTNTTSSSVRKTLFGAAVRLQSQPVASAAVDRIVVARSGSASWLTPMPLSAFEVPTAHLKRLVAATAGESHPSRGPSVSLFLTRDKNRDAPKTPPDAFCVGPLASGVLHLCKDGSVVSLVPLGGRFADVVTTLEMVTETFFSPASATYNEIGETIRPEAAVRSTAESSRRVANHGRKSVGVTVVNGDAVLRMTSVVPAEEDSGSSTSQYACDEQLWQGLLLPTIDAEYPMLALEAHAPLRQVLTAFHAICA